MAAQATEVTTGTALPCADVFLSRQPVVDRELRVAGYRVAYAAIEPEDLVARGTLPATSLFGDVFNTFTLDDLVGDSLAHVPVSAELLLAIGTPPVPPDRVLLRIGYETATDPSLATTLRRLADAGYKLAVHNLPGPGFDRRVLGVASVVELDLADWDELEAAAAVPEIATDERAPLAGGLNNYTEFELARAIGFQLFAGPFYASPRVSSARQVPAGDATGLAALARLQGDVSVEELERAIDHDVGLSVKLLRHINSAYFGMRREITSIRQAVLMLGARRVSQWASLIALTGGPTTPRELSVMALTRARMCQLLGPGEADVSGDELFTIGLLSVADALLELPLETIVGQLPLADHISQALLWRAGKGGEILAAAVAFEQGSFGADGVRRRRGAAATAYRESLRWARETLSALG